MRRYALRDDQWDRIKDILPGREGHVGATARDNRLFVDAVIYRYRAGIPWRDLPERFGAWKAVHTRFSRWGKERCVAQAVRASRRRRRQRIRHDRQHHRARSSAWRRRPKKDGEDQAIGRSKGGLSTKIHTLVDALGNPVGFFPTPGQAHDLQGADALLPDMKADTLLADKAFDADQRVIEPLQAAGKTCVIPSTSNRKKPRPYDKEIYKARHLIENFNCSLKRFRAIATRYDKTATNFLAAIHLAAAIIWLN
ncbi:MAG: IS5 family transposase [Reyranellaceae bacterium]